MDDALQMALLLDYYGGLLTEKQRACFDLRYNQDLSLGEIGEALGVSRQAVCDNLSRTEAVLRKTEEAVGCVSRGRRVRFAADTIRSAARILAASSDENVSALARQILSAADELEE